MTKNRNYCLLPLLRLQTVPLLLTTCLVILAFLPVGGVAQETGVYEYKKSTRDGTGKIYMGREISHVMGHLGASWLERPQRDQEEKASLLVKNLPLEPGDTVADIGAGTGYFSFRMAERVPQGEVLAVDIQQEMLDIIELRKMEGFPENVDTVLGTERDPRLPVASIDLILLVDAYHEFSWPREMGEAMATALKPGGRLILVEYRGEDASIPIKRLHKMTQKQARREMEAIGLEWESTKNFLPQQHFMIFRRPLHCTEGSPNRVLIQEKEVFLPYLKSLS